MTKCPICESRRSPHRAGESLHDFRSALAALGFGPTAQQAHPSCIRRLVTTRMRAAVHRGHKMPPADAAISTKLEALRGLRGDHHDN